jgi:hypothetical protein
MDQQQEQDKSNSEDHDTSQDKHRASNVTSSMY